MNLLSELWKSDDCRKVAEGVLAASDLIWGEDLNAIPGLTDMVTADLEAIKANGMRAAVEAIL